MIVFLFDRCLGVRIPRELRRTRSEQAEFLSHQECFGHGAMPDDKWLRIAGENGWVVVTKDRKFHKREAEYGAAPKPFVYRLQRNGRLERVVVRGQLNTSEQFRLL